MRLYVLPIINTHYLEAFQGGFDVALSLVYQPTCRLFGKRQMSLSLFCYNTKVAVVLNLWDAASNFYNLPLLVHLSDQPHKNLRNFTYKFLIASLEIKVTGISL